MGRQIDTLKGIMMPAIKNMPKKQVTYLWKWLQSIAHTPMPAYQPTTPTTRPNKRNTPTTRPNKR